MSYPFVPSPLHYGPRLGPALAFVVHMAENDGGTVAYLARDPARGVSVHYVIENTGRIVQMVHERDATGSINPRSLRAGDDANGFYGETAARACLGGWYSDPNAATITCEMDGRAKDGPNGKQAVALVTLTDDLRTRYPRIGMLGHRDFQDYKPCPGKLVPWSLFGGHGPAGSPAPAPGDEMRFVNANGATVTTTRKLNVTEGSAWSYLDGSAGGKMPATTALPWVGKGDSDATEHVVLLTTGTPYPDGVQRPTLVLVRSSNSPIDVPTPPVDCDDVVAVELEAAAARASAAVLARP